MIALPASLHPSFGERLDLAVTESSSVASVKRMVDSLTGLLRLITYCLPLHMYMLNTHYSLLTTYY